MSHIAIQEALDGKNVNWLQKVTDAEYLAGLPADSQSVSEGVPQRPMEPRANA
jgi:hypothetical protein